MADSPVKRQKELRAWLEDAILKGELKPGDAIDEQSICRRFGVSRTPVREAFLQLASLDLIEFRPRRGAVVKQMSVKQIAAMWEVLTSLEGLAAGLAARRMTSEDRQYLSAIHEEARPYMTDGLISAYDDANRRFHEVIYAGCRNDYLANQAMTIRLRLKPYRQYPFQRAGGLARSFRGHELVLAAIISGEDEKASEAMREHVAGGLSFLDLVAELPSSGSETEVPAAERSEKIKTSPPTA